MEHEAPVSLHRAAVKYGHVPVGRPGDGQLIEDGAEGDALQGPIDHEGEGALVVVLAKIAERASEGAPVEPGHGNKELVLEIHGAMIGRQPRPRLYAAPLGGGES